MTRKNELVPILPAERDPRLITMRRGGTLTDEHHRLLAEWAALCAEHVLHLFEQEQPRDTRPRDAIDIGRSWIRGEVACVMRTRPHSWRMLPHMDCPTRRSSPLLRPGKQWRWPTSQPTTWELRHMRSGQPLLPLSPVRQSQHAFGNETGSEKEFPRRFKSWSLMTSSVEARSAGTSSTTDL